MKKKEKLLREMGEMDDAYIAEADPTRVYHRGMAKRRKWSVIAAVAAMLVVSMGLWLFIPFNTTPPELAQYADSEYYDLIVKLNELTYSPPADKNNYEVYVEGVWDVMAPGAVMERDDAVAGEAITTGGVSGDYYYNYTDGATGTDSGSDGYVEVTDNQVKGVIEGDLLKRTRDRAFYLSRNTLRIYSIEGEDSRELGSYQLDSAFMTTGYYYYNHGELYLSPDGKTATLVLPYSINSKGAQVGVISLDVSDPANIREKGTVSISGGYLSSRSVDGKLLLISQFYVGKNPDFSDESTFVPQIKIGEEQFSIPFEDILIPEMLNSARYTVVCQLDEQTLSLDGCTALLSYTGEIYVNTDSIYATRRFSDRTEADGVTTYTNKTEITRVRYGGEGFALVGSVVVDGSVKDQYSMDEYNGIFRVVTTTSSHKVKETVYADGNAIAEIIDGSKVNANLYLINADEMKIVNAEIAFAPWGEQVQSVRFDGDIGYVCTSVQLSDPVFFFDLSDVANITWKETGTIEGFSSSLVNFYDGFLLGIGRGNGWGTVKIEVYEESGEDVVSVAKYEVANGDYSTEYKSYLIDRENGLLGLGIYFYEQHEYGMHYVLLHFDGYGLHEIAARIPVDGNLSELRAFIEDGYLYVFSNENLDVVAVGK